MRTAGIDGCRAGWLLASLDDPEGVRLIRTEEELAAALRMYDLVFIDIPIGLPDEEAHRECDRTLRRRLSPGRSSSVFSAPLRGMLDATSHAHACEMGRRIHGKGISLQTWNIVPKIRQVDGLLRRDPALQAKVLESHPEWLFMWFLNASVPLPFSKKTAEGRSLRRQILSAADASLGARVQDGSGRIRANDAAPDDLLDAWALALAAHIAGRSGVRALTDGQDGSPARYGSSAQDARAAQPADAFAAQADQPAGEAAIRRDAIGLPMAIWYPAVRSC